MNNQTKYEAALIVAHGSRCLDTERKFIAADLAATMPDVSFDSILRHLPDILHIARTVRTRADALTGAMACLVMGMVMFLGTVAWAFQVAPMA
jgi:hypothetical protein